jgi:hypothetical protein
MGSDKATVDIRRAPPSCVASRGKAGVAKRVDVAGPAELLERMLQDVFNELDPERRSAVIFTEDLVFADPEMTVTGRTELAVALSGLLAAQGPGLSSRRPVSFARWAAWASRPGGSPRRERTPSSAAWSWSRSSTAGSQQAKWDSHGS